MRSSSRAGVGILVYKLPPNNVHRLFYSELGCIIISIGIKSITLSILQVESRPVVICSCSSTLAVPSESHTHLKKILTCNSYSLMSSFTCCCEHKYIGKTAADVDGWVEAACLLISNKCSSNFANFAACREYHLAI